MKNMNIVQLIIVCLGITALIWAYYCPPFDYENLGGFTRHAYRNGPHASDNVNMGRLYMNWAGIAGGTAILTFLCKSRKKPDAIAD